MDEKIQLNSEVSRRYSKALFKIAKEKNTVQKIYKEVNDLLELLENNIKFTKILQSPLLSSKNQLTVITGLFSDKDNKKILVSKHILFFLKVLAKNGRLNILLGVFYSFKYLVESLNEVVNVNLTTAIPINEEVLKNLKKALSKKTEKKLNITANVDKKIIGGIILSSGSNLIDASIRNKILKLNSITKGVS